ncbi:alpha/beta fold hydrolase [Amycolatopsis sp. WGS_07]|uniref:alpha/beta fold hydrolase n=1 Tax=Amycolatopsis sp. WGS_07 TaxID=3076764 RepID=UPI0038733038
MNAAPAADAGGCLTPLNGRAGELTSVLIHPAGGGLGAYLGLAAMLSRRGMVHGLRASGLRPGEEPDRTIEALTARYLPLIEALPDRPGLLAGWSLGGILAWELAVRLAVTGPPPAVLLIDSLAAPLPGHRIARTDLRAAVLSELAGEPDPAVRERALRTADAHLSAAAGYLARSVHLGPALLITCAGEERAGQAEHWARHCPGLRAREIPGGHFDVFTGENLALIRRHLDDFLSGRT